MKFLVVGGHSPIAMEISKSLATTNQVWHVTRNIDTQIVEYLSSPNINFLEWDLSAQHFFESYNHFLTEHDLDGIVFAHKYRGITNDDHERFQIEVLSPWCMAKAFCEIESKKSRKLLFFTSPAAELVLDDQPFIYHASKAAINQLIKYLSVFYGRNGVTTNGISPGSFIYKDRAKSFWNENPNYLQTIENLIPVKRIGQIDDLVELVMFLLLSSTNFINGTIIDVDGGLKNNDTSKIMKDLMSPDQ
jgi:NAD(P)-dependent dehydrogenase (short-subunit alcohol dehydrogenase family)